MIGAIKHINVRVVVVLLFQRTVLLAEFIAGAECKLAFTVREAGKKYPFAFELFVLNFFVRLRSYTSQHDLRILHSTHLHTLLF